MFCCLFSSVVEQSCCVVLSVQTNAVVGGTKAFVIEYQAMAGECGFDEETQLPCDDFADSNVTNLKPGVANAFSQFTCMLFARLKKIIKAKICIK